MVVLPAGRRRRRKQGAGWALCMVMCRPVTAGAARPVPSADERICQD